MSVLENYQDILNQIRLAEKFAGVSEGNVALMAVTKTYSAEFIRPLLRAGHRLFGENRVQEAVEKWEPLKKEFPDAKVHLIGHLQKNKVRQAVAFFDGIDTLDSSDLAEKVLSEMKMQKKNISCFVQVNTGEETQKNGIHPEKTVEFVNLCRQKGMKIEGLMCIPPVDDEPSPHFALLKKLAKQTNLSQLSMGMSHDFPIAIEQGARIVRIGTALFGERKR